MTMRSNVLGALLSVQAMEATGAFRAEFRFDPALALFRGHFPGRPIVPGVLEIEAGRCAAESFTGTRYDILRVEKAKFSAPVTPGNEITAECTLTALSDGVKLRSLHRRFLLRTTIFAANAVAATLVMALQEKAADDER